MRVGLNISAASGSFTGVGNYAFHLARTLAAVAPDDEWIFFGANEGLAPMLERDNARPEVSRRKGLSRILWEQTGLPLQARRRRIDLLHGVDFSRPLAYCGSVVNTIHDLSPFVDSHYFPLARRAYKQALISHAARRSSIVITVSEFSRKQIIERLSVDENRVAVIQHGIIQRNEVASREQGAPFLLFVGGMEFRKNLVRLVEAFALLRQRRRIRHRLILAGKPGHGWEEIRAAIERGKVLDSVETPGYVSEAEASRLYRGAELFVFPSVYEGFGMPVLEAMACGTPVACSNATSLPEVGGDAAVYFDPYSVEEMAVAIERVLDSPSLQADMRKKGLKQAAKFTWEQCARKHLEVYRQVLELQGA